GAIAEGDRDEAMPFVETPRALVALKRVETKHRRHRLGLVDHDTQQFAADTATGEPDLHVQMLEPRAVARREADDIVLYLGDPDRATREHHLTHPFVRLVLRAQHLELWQRRASCLDEERGDRVGFGSEAAGIGPAN